MPGRRERAAGGIESGRLAFPGLAQEVGEQVRALRREHALGWNWTPSSGSATWRMPITTRSTSLIAVTRNSGGSVAGSTASEW